MLALGGLCWLVGNLLWLSGLTLPQIAPWWIAFLGLTVLGERVDWGRCQRVVSAARPQLLVALGFFLVGVILATRWTTAGQRILGFGLLLLAIWLLQLRLTVHQAGLTRFIAVALLLGFGWLALSGLGFILGAPVAAGLARDFPYRVGAVARVSSSVSLAPRPPVDRTALSNRG